VFVEPLWQEPEAPLKNNATSRRLRANPGGAGGLQVAGFTWLPPSDRDRWTFRRRGSCEEKPLYFKYITEGKNAFFLLPRAVI